MSKVILIMAGGTGGHIFPALAIAHELSKHDINIQWLGSKHGMENNIVPKHNISLHTVNAVGLRGKNLINLVKAPFLLGWAWVQTFKIFLQIKPDMVLGMGGFASGMGGVIAWMLRLPLIIHEQNSVAGTTNKLLHKIAKKTFQAFDNTLQNAVTSGNPVAFKAVQKKNNNTKLNLLVLGGSLGAKPINDKVDELILDINIWHQTGSNYHKTPIIGRKVEVFIQDMASAYAWADVVLCRAGAMTVSELMLSATPAILVPLPHAIDNHQFYNAKILADNHAGILLEQQNLNLASLQKILLNLDKKYLKQMAKNAQKLAKPNAAKEITNYLLSQ